ncbi:transposase [Microbispora bryophytorum]
MARDLGVGRETLRLWVRQDPGGRGAGEGQAGAGVEALGGPTTSGNVEEENKQLKARIRELELERDSRAAKYFAGETIW